MTTPSRTCHTRDCKVDVPDGFLGKGLCLDHYLHEANQKLETATACLVNGKCVDKDTLGWLLAQVDFVVERMGDEASPFDAEQGSRLLELLLGIANLNEYIRHLAATGRETQTTGYPSGISLNPRA